MSLYVELPNRAIVDVGVVGSRELLLLSTNYVFLPVEEVSAKIVPQPYTATLDASPNDMCLTLTLDNSLKKFTSLHM